MKRAMVDRRAASAKTKRSMVLLMGVTGAGKSFFVNRLIAGSVEEGHGLNSETQKCSMVTAHINEEESIAIIDTPGLDDTKRTDDEILEEIAGYLVAQHLLGIELKGIIYFHRIIDIKMPGSAVRYLSMFQKLVGEDAATNVILATTMWSKLASEAEGLAREQELRETHWKLMEDRGSQIINFDGSSAMAEQMIMDICAFEPVVLRIQREICDDRLHLDETAAGVYLAPRLEQDILAQRKAVARLDAQVNTARHRGDRSMMIALEHEKAEASRTLETKQAGRNRLKRRPRDTAEANIEEKKSKFELRDGLTILAAIIGVTVNIVIHFLPIG